MRQDCSGEGRNAAANDNLLELARPLPLLASIMAVECVALGIVLVAALAQNPASLTSTAVVIIGGLVFVFAPVTLLLCVVVLRSIRRATARRDDGNDRRVNASGRSARRKRSHLRLVKTDR